MLSKGQLSFLLWVLTTCPCSGLPSSVGVPELRPRGACPGPPAGLGVLPLWEADLHWSAPANPSLLAWQPKDKAGQKYLCGWWKVNSSASLFFPGNRGHRQIQQNRSRDRAQRGSCGVSEGALPPPRPLLPVAIWLCHGVGGRGSGWGRGAVLQGLRIMASCNETCPHLAQPRHRALGQTD